jgi:hypothetical protein
MVASVEEETHVQKQQQQQLQQQPVQTMKEKMMATASFRQFQAAVHAKVRRRRATTASCKNLVLHVAADMLRVRG